MDCQDRPKLNIFAVLYSLTAVAFVCFLLISFIPASIGIIRATIAEGAVQAASIGIGSAIMTFISLFLMPSFFIPALRNIYKAFPWLLPFIILFSLNCFIFIGAMETLNKGYEVQSSARHYLFITLMLIQIIVCRLGMCAYFHYKPASLVR